MIKKCDHGCVHPYQDQRYGQGKRVMNPTADTPTMYRCTVCGKESK